MNKKITLSVISILCLTTLTACSKASTDNRQIINKSDKQITILGEQKEVTNNDVALEKIENLEGIRAIDWIDENTLLVMKENETYPKIQLDSKKAYPKNFYEYNINTKEFKLIAGSDTDMAYGVLSPDKNYIFYKEGVESNLTGFILNRKTGEKFKVTNTDSISSSEGIWIDNTAVIFSEFPQGGIYTADINGNIKPIENQPKGMISNVVKLKNMIYYTTIGGKMYYQDISGKNNKFLTDNVIWLVPSPDSENLILVKRTDKTKMTLMVADLEGNVKKTLAEGTQIFGMSLSPDHSHVAYSIAPDTSGKAGISISDIASGKTTQLTIDLQLAADPVRWSPSGKSILTSNVLIEDNSPHFITYILQLK